ncbi:MAG: hypothetical protein JWM93_222 [Frankiales bacterium]|nr:hypothetical protein [Frankiales bacterium]
MSDDIETRLRSAASSWHATADVQPPPHLTAGAKRLRVRPRWLVAATAGLVTAAIVTAVVTLGGGHAQQAVTPSGIASTAAGAPCDNAPTADSDSYRLTATDDVAVIYVCTSPDGRLPIRENDVLRPLVESLMLPDLTVTAMCAGPQRQPPLEAVLVDGRQVYLRLPMGDRGARREVQVALGRGTDVRTTTPTGSPTRSPTTPVTRTATATPTGSTCTQIRQSLTVPTAALPDGATLVDDEMGRPDTSSTRDQDFRRLSYHWGDSLITVTAGCDITTMPVHPGSSVNSRLMPGEEWHWLTGIASWEGDARPDDVVWAVPSADAWIEITATAADGGRAMGGDMFPELARHIRYTGRAEVPSVR